MKVLDGTGGSDARGAARRAPSPLLLVAEPTGDRSGLRGGGAVGPGGRSSSSQAASQTVAAAPRRSSEAALGGPWPTRPRQDRWTAPSRPAGTGAIGHPRAMNGDIGLTPRYAPWPRGDRHRVVVAGSRDDRNGGPYRRALLGSGC